MRLSRLTMFLDKQEHGALLHAASGSMDLLRGPTLEAVRHLVKKDGDARLIPQQSLTALAMRGHLTELGPTEELMLLHEYAQALSVQNRWLQRQSGYVMLLLSYACNFACKYCYQHDIRPYLKDRRMSPREIDLFFDVYREQLCPGATSDRMCYILYGGEPLTLSNRPTIERILRRASQDGAEVEAVTNGYLLDAYLDLIGERPGRISKLQISFDAEQALHDSLRVTAAGNPTFDRILGNVVKAAELDVRLQLRTHMHRDGAQAIRAFLSLLEDKGLLDARNVEVYLSYIKYDMTNAREDLPLMEHCFTPGELASFPSCVNTEVSRYYRQLSCLAKAETGRGPANTAYCMRCKENCWVVDPFGDVYACYQEAGRPQFRVGDFINNEVRFLSYLRSAREEDAVHDNPLAMSPLALITGGGCAMTSRRSFELGAMDDRQEWSAQYVSEAFARLVEENMRQKGFENTDYDMLPINYQQDGSRTLQNLLNRALVFKDRLEASTRPPLERHRVS